MGWRIWAGASGIAACGLALVASAGAQYPGRVAKSGKAEPVLRSVAVLEWVGSPGKPSASRLVPVAVFDGEQLNDGTIYLSRPEPLALSGGVEYELQTAGKAMGLFDVFGAGEVGESWRGFGVWKPLSAKDAAAAAGAFNTSSLTAPVRVEDDEHPVLKRKHPKGTDGDEPQKAEDAASTADTSAAKAPVGDADPDRPTLKRKSSGDSAAGGSGSTDKGPAPVAVDDPERPTIRRNRKSVADAAMAQTSTAEPDPDRPRLKRGRPENAPTELPKLEGMPPTMQQAVAVSDTRFKPEHPWKYTWADPADELKMKAALEAMARTALGLDAPVKPVRKVAGKRAAKPAEPQAPVELADENFRVFELTFGSSATMVLTASSAKPEAGPAPVTPDASGDEPPRIQRGKPVTKAATPDGPTKIAPAAKAAPQKFVTLIAQPDLYGGVIVVFKSVTDLAHLDVTPRMRLVDAVDAEGDNRGELLFELRGDDQRQFALYRVLRGSAEQLFATVGIP